MSARSCIVAGVLVCAGLLGPALADPPKPPPAPEAANPALAISPTGTPVQKLAWLHRRINTLIETSTFKNAKVGLAVVDIESGRSLYARNDKTALNPASNAKLVTTAAALGLLGPEYRYKTVIYGDSLGRDGTINGNLYLKGFGDPSLATEDLWKLVSDLHTLGVKRVTGEIVIDDSFFDDVRLPPAYDQKQEDAAWRAPTGAASLNYNAISISVAPGGPDGAPVRVTLDPFSAYVVLENHARTTTAGQPVLTVATAERQDRTVVTLSGKMLRGSEARTFSRRVVHPDLYIGFTLLDLLARKSIKLAKTVPQVGLTPPKARPLASHASQPLSVLIRDVNKRSNNFMAEQILKTLGAETAGRPGTWQKGLDAIARYLEELGIPKGSYQMQNGSGLYDADRLSAQQIVEVLRKTYRDFRLGADFAASLAVAGTDGTVSHRMEGGGAERYVRVKTGTLADVSCLSGYAAAANRPPLAFSILINNVPDGAAAEARRLEDAIAQSLVAYLEATR